MATAKRFEDLDVRQRAKELTNLIYGFSSSGMSARDFGLRDQMRWASLSIMSNIAEWCSKQLARLTQYLESQPNSRPMREDGVTYDVQH
jgi:hypothetical protein